MGVAYFKVIIIGLLGEEPVVIVPAALKDLLPRVRCPPILIALTLGKVSQEFLCLDPVLSVIGAVHPVFILK